MPTFTNRLFRYFQFIGMMLLVLAGVARTACACVPAETGGALGSTNSQTVYNGPGITTSGRFTFTCSGSIAIIAGPTSSLKGTLQASVTGLTLKNGANAIPYQIYSDAGMATPYTGGQLAVNVAGAALVGLLTGSGASVPIYIATTAGANIPAGVYNDTIQLTWVYVNICEGINVAGACVGTLNNGSSTRSLNVQLTVTNDCTITAPPVSFGAAPLVGGFVAVSQNISLLCTRNLVYTVGLSAGNYAAAGRRNMASGSNRLNYDIYKSDSTIWGSVSTARANGPSAADGTTTQTIPYTARVYQDQTTPVVGVYSDSVVVDVSF